MNLWFRCVLLLISAAFRPKLSGSDDISTIDLRVFPSDLDINLHLNNGRYLTLMDLGFLDILLRGGFWRVLMKTGWTPVFSTAKIRFRRELKLFQRFRLDTQIVHWGETSFLLQHRFIVTDPKNGEMTAALALKRGGIYDRKAKAFLPPGRLFDLLGYNAGTPPLAAADVKAFLEAEEAMRRMARA
jgi:acyl-CoA thioesterase FadM